MINNKQLNIIGIGAGPANLSVAALLPKYLRESSLFFEKNKTFSWHKGMMINGAKMQSSFIKDLVSPVDTNSPYSFLSYLKDKGRLYKFLAADFDTVSRLEFQDYLGWVTDKLTNIQFGSNVSKVALASDGFHVHLSEGKTYNSKHLVLGNGLTPRMPESVHKHKNEPTIFHSSEYKNKEKSCFKGKKILIVGGGQSSMEILLDLMEDNHDITLMTRASKLTPMEESTFSSDILSPSHTEHFLTLNQHTKNNLNVLYKNISDGVSQQTLKELYQKLYLNEVFTAEFKKPKILLNVEFKDCSLKNNVWEVNGYHKLKEEAINQQYDYIIFSTGYKFELPDFMSILSDELLLDTNNFPMYNNDFSLQWKNKSNDDNKIFLLNSGPNFWGIANPNIVLTAWRGAKVINSIAGHEVYTTNESAMLAYQ